MTAAARGGWGVPHAPTRESVSRSLMDEQFLNSCQAQAQDTHPAMWNGLERTPPKRARQQQVRGLAGAGAGEGDVVAHVRLAGGLLGAYCGRPVA